MMILGTKRGQTSLFGVFRRYGRDPHGWLFSLVKRENTTRRCVALSPIIFLHTEEVIGSSPVSPTKKTPGEDAKSHQGIFVPSRDWGQKGDNQKLFPATSHCESGRFSIRSGHRMRGTIRLKTVKMSTRFFSENHEGGS